MVVILPNEKCDHVSGSPQQLPLKHYLEDNNCHLEQQQLQQVIQKRRRLNESSTQLQLHLQQLAMQVTQPLEENSIESSKLGMPCPTNVNYPQQSKITVQKFKPYLKSCQFKSLEEKVSIVNNNNFLGSSFQQRSRINKKKFLLHRKAAFVENLVDTAGLIIEVTWANFSVNPTAKIIPLRLFLQETLRRSRTSYSTLQTALFYLFRIKPQISSTSRRTEFPSTPSSEYPPDSNQSQNNDPATCGRRMFLAALIVASKYLQDRNYSNRAWSKISGLPVHEINANEICFLKLIDYNLFIAEDIFKRWSSLLLTHIQAISGSDMSNPDAFRRAENQREVALFRETLRSMDPKTMDYSSVGIYPITPADSAPNSPREHNSDNMQISNSYSLPPVTQQPTPPISYGNFVDNYMM
ncbi:G1/S-specific cyclin Pcl5 [Rhizophagus clarus]|uniref:G1/S-specific cyclin Pcl5 n=1 Tax=Rhizophagus clarus TaxID=94130 RepID=A0A8H3M6M6_9GLOM|nr:G1/S-specific cyclin Pcl5 [Rhizophagus clarus]